MLKSFGEFGQTCIVEVSREDGEDVPPGVLPDADYWLLDTYTCKVLGPYETCYWLGYRAGTEWLLSGCDDADLPERLERLRGLYEATCPQGPDGDREWTLNGDHEGIIVAVEGLDPDGERDADGRLIATRQFYCDSTEWWDPDSPGSWDQGMRGFVEGIMETYWRLRCRLGLHSATPTTVDGQNN
jgi:hypothetical protein